MRPDLAIWVESELGVGTRFELYLPSTEEREEKDPNDTVDLIATSKVRRKTVLLVEDEKEVRELAHEFLSAAGFSVLTAEDGWEALQVAERLGRSIEAVLTDMVMPKMGGTELGVRLRCLQPHLKIVYMTGYTDDMVVQHKVLEPGVKLLQKPFGRVDLALKVRSTLDGK